MAVERIFVLTIGRQPGGINHTDYDETTYEGINHTDYNETTYEQSKDVD